MKPTAHASADCLTAYAAGTLPSGTSLLIACHLDYCPACRARVDRFDTLGGALMATEPSIEPDPGCLAKCLAEIDADERPACCDACLPDALRARLAGGLSDIAWEPTAAGVAVHRLPDDRGEDVRLVRADPGCRIQERPLAPQAMLVLTGRLRAGTRDYAPGDLVILPAGVEGGTEAVGAEPCTFLAARR